MKFFGIAWLVYLFWSSWFSENPILQSTLLKQTWLRSHAIAHSFSTTYSIAFFLPGCGWIPDPACLSRSATQSSDGVAEHPPFSAALHPERSAAAPFDASIPSLDSPLRKVYGRLSPLVRGDRPTSNTPSQVRLVRVDLTDPESVASQNMPLFHACEVPGAESTLAQSYAVQAPYQVWVRDNLVLALSEQTAAEALVQRLHDLLETPGFDANRLAPRWVEGDPAITVGDQVLLTIDPLMEQSFRHNADLMAIDWTNNLRRALGAEPLSLTDAQTQLYGLVEGRQQMGGTASWYGPYFHKRLTANGERFDQYALTVAHKTLRFNTFLKVTNRRNGESVIVRVNDRGPYIGERSLDLSYQAARCINSDEAGVVAYEAIFMAPGVPDEVQIARPAPTAEDSPRRIAGSSAIWERPPID